MLCQEPYVKAGQAFPCGKCLPCLVRRRKLWTHRLMLESLCHSDNAFVTLTYADDTLPADLSLQPAHLQDFLKRLRSHMEYHYKKRIRFYGVGEYGDKSSRPHYHAILFNYVTCLRGRSVYRKGVTKCCSSCDLIRDLWGYGNVGLGSLTTESAGYTLGYIVKNMRRTDDARLKGRWPEFARMSLRPGLGYGALDEIAKTIIRYNLDDDPIPTVLRQGKSMKPLGRYLRSKLKDMVNADNEEVAVDEEMQALWEVACSVTPKGGEVRRNLFKNMLIEVGEQRVLNMAARMKIKQKGPEL